MTPLPPNPNRYLAPFTGAVARPVTDKLGEVVNVDDFGALGDNSTDNSIPLANAVAALPVNGGVLEFGPGKYQFATGLDLSGKRSITFRGRGGRAASDTSATILLFTGTGSGRAIDARDGYGHTFEDLQLLNSSGSFTGVLLDLSHNTGGGDPAFHHVRRCQIGSTGGAPTATATGIKLDHCLASSVEGCGFVFCDIALYGRSSGGYANGIHVTGCHFDRSTTAHLRNPGEAWTVSRNTFEPLIGGIAGAVDHEAAVIALGLTYVGNWHGDVTAGGTWLKFSGRGLEVAGNEFGGDATSHAIDLDENGCSGVSIHGNNFLIHAVAVYTSHSGHSNVSVGPNAYSSVSLVASVNILAASGGIRADGGIGVGVAPSPGQIGVTGSTTGQLFVGEWWNSNTTAGATVVANLGVFNGNAGLWIEQCANASGASFSVGAYDAFIRTVQGDSQLHLGAGNVVMVSLNSTTQTISTPNEVNFEVGGLLAGGYLAPYTGAVARSLTDKLGEVLSAKDFGAIGDDSTTNTTALQAAIGAIPAAGGALYFPRGIYRTGQLNTGDRRIVIFGEGIDATVIKAVAGAGTPLVNMAPSSPTYGCGVHDLTIDCTLQGDVDALCFANIVNGHIERVKITLGNKAVRVVNGGNNFVSNVYLYNPGDSGFCFECDGGAEHTARDCVVYRDAAGTTDAGVRLIRTTATDTGGLYLDNVRVIRVGGGSNILNYGFFLSSSANNTAMPVFMTGCVADNISFTGVVARRLKDVLFAGGWLTAGEWCARLLGTGGGVRFLDNLRLEAASGSFLFESGGDGALDRFTSVGNHLVTGTSYYLAGSPTPTAILIADNDDIATTLTNDPTNLYANMTPSGRQMLPIVATGSLPAAAARMDGSIIVEDNGSGDRNLVFYVQGQRFRVDGGSAF